MHQSGRHQSLSIPSVVLENTQLQNHLYVALGLHTVSHISSLSLWCVSISHERLNKKNFVSFLLAGLITFKVTLARKLGSFCEYDDLVLVPVSRVTGCL